MKIEITIKSNSKASMILKKSIEEKDSFRKAVREGEAINYTKQHQIKFATPVRIK